MFLETKFSNEISNNWPNDLLETNLYKTPDFYWQILLTIQCMNNTSVITK